MSDAKASPVSATCAGPVLRITLSDPASGNLLNDDALGAILSAMDRWSTAPVLVLSAQGENFSVGRPKPRASAGLSEIDAQRVRAALKMVHDVNVKLRQWPGASVAILQGAARGAAAGFLLNCDVVLAQSGSTLGFPEITYDLPPAIVASYLPNRVAPRVAQYLLLTGSGVDVERALAWGLVHEVHGPETISDRADELICFFSSRAPGAIDRCKIALAEFTNEPHVVAGPKGIDSVIDWLRRSP